ncbi:MAG: hypothetical protein M0026_10405 [Nocardiopsaceae bacterium]|nr:hypothetical protein [Nocardiopsaceae bacterium]
MASKKSHRSRTRRRNPARTVAPAAPPPIEFTEQERPEPPGPDTPPYALMHKLLSTTARDRARAVNAVREESRGEIEEHRRRYTEIATGVAAALHELRQLLSGNDERLREAGFADQADTLTALDRRIVAALGNAGVRFIDPVGEPYLAVADHISVRHRPADTEDADLVVAETVRPGVLLDDGELVRPAQVLLGAAAERGRAQEGADTGKAPDPETEAEAAERPEDSGAGAADPDRRAPEAGQDADTRGEQVEKTGTEEDAS